MKKTIDECVKDIERNSALLIQDGFNEYGNIITCCNRLKLKNMSQICNNIKEWIEEEIEQRIRDEERRRERRCRNQRRWWQKLLCWFVWILLVTFRIVIVTVGKWITTIVCYTITGLLNILSGIVNLVFAIPIIGSFLKIIYEFFKGWSNRIIKLIFEPLTFWIPKKIKIHILVMNGQKGLATQQHIDDCVNATKEMYKQYCNINIKILDIKFYSKNTPSELRLIDCENKDGLAYSLGNRLLKLTNLLVNDYYDENFATLSGIGQSAFIIFTAFDENNSNGKFECDGVMHNSFSTNFVFIDTNCHKYTMGHELGHLLGKLGHSPNDNQLMREKSGYPQNPKINAYTRTMFRTSKYCHFI